MPSTRSDRALAVVARAVTINLERPADQRRRAHYALEADRWSAVVVALSARVKPWALAGLLSELADARVADPGDLVVRRDWGAHGWLKLTVLGADRRLVSRFHAVARLADLERELYLDALIDDALEEREPVRRVHLAEPTAIHAQAPAPRRGAGAFG
jgi:hypothetical protein